MTRAQSWVDAQVPYSETAYYTNQYGQYRTDCSGFVSMAWNLVGSETTYTLDPGLSSWTHKTTPISWAALRPGDALVIDSGTEHHMSLFVQWNDQAETSFDIMEEPQPGGHAQRISNIATSNTYWNRFTPVRYNNMVSAPSGYQVAFQAAGSSYLWTVGTFGNKDWQLGMKAGTSPSVAKLPTGGFQAAFQANTGDLWSAGSAGTKSWNLGMGAGTSPSIAALAGGGYEIAVQTNGGQLWTTSNTGATTNWGLGMKAGTSPSITALPGGGFQVAVQANTGDLWSVGTLGTKSWNLGMKAGSSPSITALPAGGYEIAVQTNGSQLWTTSNTGATTNTQQGMAGATSPSIAALAGGVGRPRSRPTPAV